MPLDRVPPDRPMTARADPADRGDLEAALAAAHRQILERDELYDFLTEEIRKRDESIDLLRAEHARLGEENRRLSGENARVFAQKLEVERAFDALRETRAVRWAATLRRLTGRA